MTKRLLLAAVLTLGLTGAAQAQSQPFVGQVMIFGGNFCPVGWAPMEGQVMSISENVALFSLLGNTYGGDGVKTFALPKAKPFKTFEDKQTLTQCIALFGVFPPRS